MTSSVKAAELTGVWTVAEPQGLQFTDVMPTSQSEAYLYNPTAKMFFASGNEWNTRAGIAEFGYYVYFTESTEADAPEGSYEFWNLCTNPNRVFTNETNLFTDDGGSTWVDHASQANYSWGVTKVGDFYRIQNVSLIADISDYEGKYFGWKGDYADMRLYMITPEEGAVDWKFVTAESYQTFIESDDYEAYKASIATCASALKLKAAIEAAELVYVDVDAAVALYNTSTSTAAEMDAATAALKEITDVKNKLKAAIEAAEEQGFTATDSYKAVLMNKASTKAEVEQAIADLSAAYSEWTKNNATWEKPGDLTSKIVNATFDNGNCTTGWSGDAFGRGGTVADGAEHYSKNYNTYQKITGLAPGVYSIGVKGFYRAGNYGGDAESHWLANDEASKYAKLYGQVGDNYYEAPIANVMSGAQTENPGGNEVSYVDPTTEETVTVYVPNTMAQGDIYFHTLNQYANKVYVAVDETGELTIGVKKTQQIGGDWSLFDDFSLAFYGSGADACQGFINEAMKNFSDYEIAEGTLYTAAYLTAYQQAYQGEKTASTMNEVNAILNAISTAKANLDKNIELWKDYQAVLAKAKAIYENPDYNLVQPEVGDLYDYCEMDDAQDILDELALTNEELEAEIAKVEGWIKVIEDKRKQGLQEGDDVTRFIVNHGFDEDKDINSGAAEGWTIDAGTGSNITRGPLGQANKDLMVGALGEMNYCFEAWHRYNWDVWQEITNLPKGIYELQVQGYVRCEMDGYTKGDDLVAPYTSPVYLYMNNSMSQFPSVYSQSPDEIGQTMVKVEDWYEETVNDLPYPNSMGGAAQCFAWGMYKTTAYGLVAEDGGNFRIGVKMIGNSNWWCIWDSFKLTFHKHTNAELLKPILEEALAGIDLSKPMGKDIFERASQVKTDAEAAIAAKDGEKMFESLNAVYDLSAAIIESVALFEQLVAANESLFEAIQNGVNTDAIRTATNLYNTISSGVDEHSITDAEAKAYMEQIDVLYTKLALPNNIDEASDTNPIDVTAAIKSPSFTNEYEESSSAGWTNPGNLGNDDTQKGAGAIEFWQIAFDMFQTIKGLPEGTYELTVDAWSRIGGNDENYAEWTADNNATMALLYGVSGDSTVYTSYIANVMKAGDAMLEAIGYEGETEFTTGDITYYMPGSLVSGKGLIEMNPGVYTNSVIVKVGADETLTIGIKKGQEKSNSWVVCDDFKLYYLGKNSAKQPGSDLTGIEDVNAQSIMVEFFTLDGRKVTNAQKGIVIKKITLDNGATLIQKIRK
ncbi:hypothetical protein [uncultured Prevotella sp.]|uniref:hypothetical protein n=1 Tax=uncultured Prevotella sp. TaxID=159272 RepID=UPI0026000C75|nr:hypothetical protein [uncultured Prevotella sp.]